MIASKSEGGWNKGGSLSYPRHLRSTLGPPQKLPLCSQTHASHWTGQCTSDEQLTCLLDLISHTSLHSIFGPWLGYVLQPGVTFVTTHHHENFVQIPHIPIYLPRFGCCNDFCHTISTSTSTSTPLLPIPSLILLEQLQLQKD